MYTSAHYIYGLYIASAWKEAQSFYEEQRKREKKMLKKGLRNYSELALGEGEETGLIKDNN